jgi:hypothetical protein
MAFSAFFYGTEPSNTGQTFIAGIIGALVMIPVSNVFPSIFAFTNTFVSQTIRPKVPPADVTTANGAVTADPVVDPKAMIPIRGFDTRPQVPSVMVKDGPGSNLDPMVASQLSALRSFRLADSTGDRGVAGGDEGALPVPMIDGTDADLQLRSPVIVRRSGGIVGRPTRLTTVAAMEVGSPHTPTPSSSMGPGAALVADGVTWSFPALTLAHSTRMSAKVLPHRRGPKAVEAAPGPIEPLTVEPIRFSMESMRVPVVSLFALMQALTGAFMTVYSIFLVITDTNRSGSVAVVGGGGVVVSFLGVLGLRVLRTMNFSLCFTLGTVSLLLEVVCGLVVYFVDFDGALTLIRVVAGAQGLVFLLGVLGTAAILRSKKKAAINKALLARLDMAHPATGSLTVLAQSFRWVAVLGGREGGRESETDSSMAGGGKAWRVEKRGRENIKAGGTARLCNARDVLLWAVLSLPRLWCAAELRSWRPCAMWCTGSVTWAASPTVTRSSKCLRSPRSVFGSGSSRIS